MLRNIMDILAWLIVGAAVVLCVLVYAMSVDRVKRTKEYCMTEDSETEDRYKTYIRDLEDKYKKLVGDLSDARFDLAHKCVSGVLESSDDDDDEPEAEKPETFQAALYSVVKDMDSVRMVTQYLGVDLPAHRRLLKQITDKADIVQQEINEALETERVELQAFLKSRSIAGPCSFSLRRCRSDICKVVCDQLAKELVEAGYEARPVFGTNIHIVI